MRYRYNNAALPCVDASDASKETFDTLSRMQLTASDEEPLI